MGGSIRSGLKLFSNNFRIYSLSFRLRFCLLDKREILVDALALLSVAQMMVRLLRRSAAFAAFLVF